MFGRALLERTSVKILFCFYVSYLLTLTIRESPRPRLSLHRGCVENELIEAVGPFVCSHSSNESSSTKSFPGTESAICNGKRSLVRLKQRARGERRREQFRDSGWHGIVRISDIR
jgi:hypothetical protein